tara:strand:+ start:2000 stop:2236 length:237 start_codon:yes stop_codon:yes gene_type:complete
MIKEGDLVSLTMFCGFFGSSSVARWQPRGLGIMADPHVTDSLCRVYWIEFPSAGLRDGGAGRLVVMASDRFVKYKEQE